MKVVVYTKPGCVQCNWTMRLMDKEHISYETRDVTTDAQAYQQVQDLGYSQLPVVVVSNGTRTSHWSGFKEGKIRGLKETGDY